MMNGFLDVNVKNGKKNGVKDFEVLKGDYVCEDFCCGDWMLFMWVFKLKRFELEKFEGFY